MAKPLYVAVSTQKGGAGKTTLTAVLASYLYFIRGIDLIAIDCDYPQNNLADLRDRDFILAEKSRKVNEIVFRTWKARNGCAYDIVRSTPEDALAVAESYAAMENPPRIIFFDLPGTVNNNYVINTISQMDYVFCPITTDPMVMETSVAFANIVHNTLITTAKSKIKAYSRLKKQIISLFAEEGEIMLVDDNELKTVLRDTMMVTINRLLKRENENRKKDAR